MVFHLIQVMFIDDRKSKGFGFVAFEDPEAAEKAVEELNGKEINEGKVFVANRALQFNCRFTTFRFCVRYYESNRLRDCIITFGKLSYSLCMSAELRRKPKDNKN